MKVSVIIPVYNEEKYIALCLDSLLNQEVQADEIVVVDNNSKDRTVAIAERFGVRVVTEKQQGMTYARNAGFNAAKYEIIGRIDADTRVPRDWVKRIKSAFEKGTIDAFGGPLCYDDLPALLNKQTVSMTKLSAKAFKRIKNHDVLYGPNMALTKAVWAKIKDEVRMDNSQVHEDMDLAMHIAKYGKIKFDPKNIVYTSSRRIRKNPASFFIEYPIRMIKTMQDDTKESTFNTSLKKIYKSLLPLEEE